jgi:hypothetical protein
MSYFVFFLSIKARPSKRKTMDTSTDHIPTKTLLTFQEKIRQIDRIKYNVLEYATTFLHIISDENNKTLPTLEQLQLLEHNILRYYWTLNQQKTWSQILDIIKNVFMNESMDDFHQSYSKQLLEMHMNDQIEIERLLQITI